MSKKARNPDWFLTDVFAPSLFFVTMAYIAGWLFIAVDRPALSNQCVNLINPVHSSQQQTNEK